MILKLELTNKQADKLYDVLSSATDRGPLNEGWQSDELEELCFIIDEAVEAE